MEARLLGLEDAGLKAPLLAQVQDRGQGLRIGGVHVVARQQAQPSPARQQVLEVDPHAVPASQHQEGHGDVRSGRALQGRHQMWVEGIRLAAHQGLGVGSPRDRPPGGTGSLGHPGRSALHAVHVPVVGRAVSGDHVQMQVTGSPARGSPSLEGHLIVLGVEAFVQKPAHLEGGLHQVGPLLRGSLPPGRDVPPCHHQAVARRDRG